MGGHIAEQSRHLNQRSDLFGCFFICGFDVIAKNFDVSAGWRAETDNGAHGGRLARAVWTEQADNVTFVYIKGDVFDAASVFIKFF